MTWSYEKPILRLVAPALAAIITACARAEPSLTAAALTPLSSTAAPSPNASVLPVETSTAPAEDHPWRVREVSVSPDKLWVARSMYLLGTSDGQSKTRIEVTSSDNGRAWSETYEWQVDPQLTTATRVVHWSDDGERLYFSNAIQLSGCQAFTNGGDLSVLELQTGVFKELLPMQAYGIGTWFSVSPDGRAVAFPIDVMGRSITIADLEDGKMSTIQLDFAAPQPGHRIGHIVWSPDSARIAFTISFNPCDPIEKGPVGSAVGIADTRTLTSKVLFAEVDRYLLTESWLDSSTIVLSELQARNLFVDANAGTFIDP